VCETNWKVEGEASYYSRGFQSLMAIYPFKCLNCGMITEVTSSIKEDLPKPKHCLEDMEQIIGDVGFVLGRTVGVRSGFYDLDYGRRATEDLTVPGKMEELKKAGVLKDPFDDVPKQTPTMEDYRNFSE